MTSAMDLLSFLASNFLSGCKAAGHLPLSRHEVLPGEFLGCRHRNEHEPEVQEGIQERIPGQRRERPELELEYEALDVLEVLGGGCSAASLLLGSASIGLTLVHYRARNIGLLEARLTNVIVHHGALRT